MKKIKSIFFALAMVAITLSATLLAGCGSDKKPVWGKTFVFDNFWTAGWSIDAQAKTAEKVVVEYFDQIDLTQDGYMKDPNYEHKAYFSLKDKTFKNGKELYNYIGEEIYLKELLKSFPDLANTTLTFGTEEEKTLTKKTGDSTATLKLIENQINDNTIAYDGFEPKQNGEINIETDSAVLTNIMGTYGKLGLYIYELSYPLEIHLALKTPATNAGETVTTLQLDMQIYWTLAK